MDANSPHLHTEADLQGSIETPHYILRPILPRGRLVLLVGDSTQGKTPFCYQLVNDLLGQRDFLDYFPFENDGPVNVAVIDAESLPEDIPFRIRMQRAGRPIQPTGKLRYTDRNSTVELGFNVCDPTKLIDLVRDERIDVLIIDNLRALSSGADVSKGHIATQIITQLNRLIALPHKPTIVILHHPRKGSAAHPFKCSILDPNFMHWLQELSGSMVWANRTDVRLGLEQVTRNDAEFTVLRGRHRVPGGDQDIGPIYLTIDEQHDLAAIDRSPEMLANLGPKQQEIATKLRLKKKFTRKDAHSYEIKGDTCKRWVNSLLKTLLTHGFIKEVSSGTYEWIEPGEQKKEPVHGVIIPEPTPPKAGDTPASTKVEDTPVSTMAVPSYSVEEWKAIPK